MPHSANDFILYHHGAKGQLFRVFKEFILLGAHL